MTKTDSYGVSNDEIRETGSNLSIPLYVRADNRNGSGNGDDEAISLKQTISDWQKSSRSLRSSMTELLQTLKE